ncbi:MAG: hypothetical protein Q8R06_15245 [Polaromonas sp.]|uniref:hypothetical protein n=1 Tax=Polaromonas sp. TaxID=1869339 RepID=UPI0027360923|nr:hypothetical protein [Polaromonas sp.]MDP3798476.1 hypothetical protein [Polaromonas sp.]
MKHELTAKDIVAYHEAGHAVMRWALGVGLNQISVGDFEGKVMPGVAISSDFDPAFMLATNWTQIEKNALILLAGELAERAYIELREEDVDEYLSVHDQRKLAELLQRVGEHEHPLIDLSEKTLRDKADLLIVEHWDRIEALAKELMKNGEMSGHQAIRIIESRKMLP